MRYFLASLALTIVACGGAVAPEDNGVAPVDPNVGASDRPLGPHGTPEEPPQLGAHVTRDAGPPSRGGSSPNMSWHNGTILNNTVVRPIFWGPKWADNNPQPGFDATTKMEGMDRFYAGLGGTAYASSNAEYTGTNGSVGTGVSTQARLVDLSTGPGRSPKTSAILAEVCKMIASPEPSGNGYYPVYTDQPRLNAGYCAWHSYGVCNGVNVQFAFFFALDGDAGCDPQDSTTGHAQGLAAIANVSGHEWSETITDPRNGGWWDSSGNENGDKCAWSFPPTNVVLGTESWKVQGNWSNAAYNALSGYPNRDGVKGCLPSN